ncbi:MAG: glycerol-3-phosphate 1-O-acyltransferase PlsY [Clostridia bacterium]|nr:glycerol-3-phosphate 1-O-acyltransferase PlsY [Clostridia bacterium]
MLNLSVIYAVLTVIAAYLMGSINFAVIFTKAFIKSDIRDFGSGNAGTTNVMRVGGFLPGLLTFVCDALKGFVACEAGYLIFDYINKASGSEWSHAIYGAYICGLACMLGHVFPVFFQFKGGKGVATSVGIFAVCCPIAIIIGLAAFAVSTLITRIVSLSSIIATLVVVALSLIYYTDTALFLPQAIPCILMGIVVILKHKDNIKRLIKGEEKKLKIRR